MTAASVSGRAESRSFALVALFFEILYAGVAVAFARTVAIRLAPAAWFPAVMAAVALLLLLAGFSVLGRLLHGQLAPVTDMGWFWGHPSGRYAWQRPGGAALMGSGIGWGMAVLMVLPVALAGDLVPRLDTSGSAIAAGFATLLGVFLTCAFVQTIFSGYILQRLARLTSPVVAVLTLAVAVGAIAMRTGIDTRAELLFDMLEQILLGFAALRTRNLWLPVMIAASSRVVMLLAFGLPAPDVSAIGVVQSRAAGPLWLTGGFAGPMGSFFGPLVVLLAIYTVARWTRRDVIGEIRGAAYVVDMDANRAPNPVHAAYNDPPAPSLVQILSTTPYEGGPILLPPPSPADPDESEN